MPPVTAPNRRLGRPLVRALVQLGAIALAVAVLAPAAARLDWSAMLAAVPREPLLEPQFWIVLLTGYLALPVADAWLHGYVWRRPMAAHLGVFVVKKACNFALLSYLGDAYVLRWARRRLGMSLSQAFPAVRDINFMSVLIANAVTLLLCVVALTSPALQPIVRENRLPVLLLLLFSLLLAGAMLAGSARIFALTRRQAMTVSAVHGARIAVTLGAQAWCWAQLAPQVPLSLWLLFAALQLLVSRLPLLPNRDLVFAGAGITAATALGLAPGTVDQAVLASALLTQALHATVLITAALTELQGAKLQRAGVHASHADKQPTH